VQACSSTGSRLAGRGEARAKSLSAEERSRIAREAVEKRWERAGKLRPESERIGLRATHKRDEADAQFSQLLQCDD
jgi:hypothetical protein